jgi:hypothetical protein
MTTIRINSHYFFLLTTINKKNCLYLQQKLPENRMLTYMG